MLFDVPTESLTGIAKLAANSTPLETKAKVEYREIPTRSYIGRCSGARFFEWTVNPYRGCEFGCKYCYARYAHEFMELRDGAEFETKIFAKSWNEQTFRRELSRIPLGESLCLGTATDPYQPAERRYGITRKMLRVIAGQSGHHLFITTKSDLVSRDADILQEIAKRNRLNVSLTITTVDDHLAALTEPFAPRPYLRFAAVKKLSQAGLRVGVLAHPMMPLINDSEKAIDRLARTAAENGAQYISAAPLFLKPCSKAVFLPFLEEQFPHLARRYRERYQRSAYLKGDYPKRIQERIEAVRIRYSLTQRVPDYDAAQYASGPQLALFE